MLYRLAIAAVLGLAALTAPADAQVVQALPSCGSASVPLGPGGRFYTDQTGNLCTAGGGGGSSGGSVTAAGTSGTQAQAVQGIAGGVPQNSFPGQYNASLPTFTSGQSGYASLDSNGRVIISPNITIGNSTNTIGNTVTASSSGSVGPAPTVTAGSSVVGKASAGNLYGFSVTAGGTAGYLALLNATAAPAASAAIAPTECVPVAVNSYVARRQDIPDRYSTGIVAVFSSSCTTFTAVAPQVVSLIVQ